MKLDYLTDLLNSNRVSVVASLQFKKINGKLICEPILSLRERNINRGPIDLLSLKTRCASLEELVKVYLRVRKDSLAVLAKSLVD